LSATNRRVLVAKKLAGIGRAIAKRDRPPGGARQIAGAHWLARVSPSDSTDNCLVSATRGPAGEPALAGAPRPARRAQPAAGQPAADRGMRMNHRGFRGRGRALGGTAGGPQRPQRRAPAAVTTRRANICLLRTSVLFDRQGGRQPGTPPAMPVRAHFSCHPCLARPAERSAARVGRPAATAPPAGRTERSRNGDNARPLRW